MKMKLPQNPRFEIPLRIALIYFLISLLWILTSDTIVWLALPLESRLWASIIKGTLFILSTTLLIYWLCRRGFEAINQSSALLQAIARETSDSLYVKDRQGKYLFVNEATANLLGRSVTEILGLDDRQLLDSQTAQSVIERDLGVMTNGEPATYEHHFTVAGRTRTMFTTKSPYRDGNSVLQGVIGISRDITERKRLADSFQHVQQVTARNLAQLKAVLANLVDGVIIANQDGKLLEWNRAAMRLFGFHGTDSLPKTMSDLENVVVLADSNGTPVHAAAWPAALLQRHEPVKGCEYLVCRKDNEHRRFVTFNGTNLADSDWDSELFVLTLHDMTSQRLATDQIIASERRFRQLADAIPHIVWTADADGSLIHVNAITTAYSGLPQESFLGAGWQHLIHPEDLPRVSDQWSTILKSHQPKSMELRIRRSDGAYRWFLNRQVSVRDAAGQITSCYSTNTDIEDLKQADAEIRRSKEMLGLFIEHVPLPIAMFDHEMRYLQVSRRWYLDYRLKDPDIIGKSHYDVFPTIPDRWKEIHQRCQNGKIERCDEDRFIREDGTDQWLRWEIHPWRNTNGQIGGIIMFTEDLSERKHASAEKERLAKIIEQSSDFIGMADLNGKLTFLNSSGRRMIGLDDDTPLDQVHFTDYVPAECHDFLLNTVIRTAREAGHWEGETQLQHLHTGQPIDVHRSTFLIHDTAGQGWYASVTRDITQLKQAQRAIRESEERYRRLVEILPDSVFIHVDERITYCNAAFIELLGVANSQEIIGRSIFEFIPPEAAEKVRQRIKQMRETGEPAPVNRQKLIRMDGREFPSLIAATPITDFGIDGILVCIHDLTLTERANDVLQSVLGSVEDPILTIDEQGTIQLVNMATERVFGYSEAELVGQNVKMLMPYPFDNQQQDTLQRFLQTEIANVIGVGREVKGRRKTGQEFPAELSVTQFQLNDKLHFTGVVRDITERKRLESAFQQAHKMEAVGRLAGGVAHDFNNLLTIINGYCNQLLKDTPAGTIHYEYLSAILDAGERATNLTQQLLAFSRKGVVEHTFIDLNEIVTRTTDLLRRLIEEDILLTVLPNAPASRIQASSGQIERAVMNLVVNARDAMTDGGHLTIATRNIDLIPKDIASFPDLKEGHYVELLVTDTGHGMSEEVMSQIFEPFFTTKSVGKGTGLGLSVVHGVVKQCGGAITVKSRPGAGTTFQLLFPVAVEASDQSEQAFQRESGRGNETILLVEDEDAVRRIARISLESNGFHVLEASCGQEAIDVAQSHPDRIDLLLTDVIMPGIGGVKLAETLQARRPGIRVLYMSGYMESELTDRAANAGIDNLISKPFTAIGLTKKVLAVLDATIP